MDESKLQEIIRLWKAFRDEETDEDGQIAIPFLHFGSGTKVSEIYDWFDCRYPGGCCALDAILEGK